MRRSMNAEQLPFSICYKRTFHDYEQAEELPFKLKLLKYCKIDPLFTKYLSSQIEPQSTNDKTLPQLSIVPYFPNKYQYIIDSFAAQRERQLNDSMQEQQNQTQEQQ